MQTFYVKRDAGGKVIDVSAYPSPGSEELAHDHADVVAFRNPPPSDDDVRRICAQRIAQTLGGKQESMLREAIHIQNVAFQGVTLTAEQEADVAMFRLINDWETAMIEKREDLISTDAHADALNDATWPAPPSGLDDFLRGY